MFRSKKITYIVLIVVCLCFVTTRINAQQIATNSNVSLSELVDNLLGSDCIEVSNINSPINGNADGIASIGAFSRAGSNFPFTDGIILSSGSISGAGNTAITAPLSEGTNSWGTDADLETTLGISNTLNATTLEFEFTSATNAIQFNYLLASEEYQQEYPCFYSDGFAILLKRVGPSNNFENIALIPGTLENVNTFNIRDTIEGFCEASNEEYFEGYNIGDTNYNGRTTVLTATASIEPNALYRIKFIIADDANSAFDSAVFLQANSFNATVDLGPDISTCASQVELNADVGNTLSTYAWFFNGTSVANSSNPTLTVNQSGEYRVIVSSPIGGSTCILEDSINVSIDAEQSVGDISNMLVCDDPSNDGVETFNLNDKIDELLAAVIPSQYDIRFFLSPSDAQNNTNPINPNYQNTSSPQTIYVRMEDTNNGCLAYPSFDLVVNPLPTPVSLPPYLICQNQTEEDFTPVDLTVLDNQLNEGNSDITVTYHLTLVDAETGTAPIEMPYNNANISEPIYVRLVNTETGCINTTTLQLDFAPSLAIPDQGAFIDLCLDPSEAFGIFDLNSVITGLLNGITGVTVTFHESFSDAEQGINPIPNPAAYQNTSPNSQTVFIRFEDNSNQCPTISRLALYTNLLETAFEDTFVSDICDDASNDGVALFDLQRVKEEVTQGLIDLNIELYPSLSDLNNQTNALDDTVLFEVSGGQDVVYAEIISESCSKTIEVTLLINNATIANPVAIDYCDDAINDGITEIILSELDAQTLQGLNPGSVIYYLTEEDANNDDNRLTATYTNTMNPQRFYVRVINDNTRCFDITFIDVSIIGRPQINQPTPLTSCDSDDDGINNVDLSNKVSEITSNPAAYSFDYYESLEDAENELSPILDPTNYSTNSTTVFIRVNDTLTNCFEILPLDIFVNTLPVIMDVGPFISCEISGTGTADFILSEQDETILNGQTEKIVLYYENQTDANNGINPIDSNTAYQNLSNPQTLFYRIENITDATCFATGTVDLEVRPAPIYNTPSDVFICDSNSGQTSYDLSNSMVEISSGSSDTLTISFHASIEDAENNNNPHPLIFTNSINPEPIFARIENQVGCVSIESFELNVVELPLINPAPDLSVCDDNLDGQVSWDLTQIEPEVLNIRQDNIEIDYFTSIEDLEAGSNAIADPSNYINTELQETVYIKVLNVISNCFAFEPIDLSVTLPPMINEFGNYQICQNESNTVDLLDINPLVFSASLSEVTISYYSSLIDAEMDVNPLDTNYSYSGFIETLFVKVVDNQTSCDIIYPFELIINEAPIVGSISDLEICDDDFDGVAAFNFTEQTANILNGLDPNTHTVTYYSSQLEAENDLNPLSTTHFSADGAQIFARLQETFTGCFSIVSFQTIVHEKPNLDIPRQTICLDNGTTFVSAVTGIEGETYLWSTGESTPSIIISEIGEYQVTVTSPFGCETTSVFEVISSESAFVELIETVDFSDPNNIIIRVSGTGDYLFSLDGGPLQSSGIFENVSLGFHEITIVDANGCAEITRTVIVVDAPKFFTPNGDGRNDRWHITGIETIPGTSISIFDRHGKLITILNANTQGWDGTYNGKAMPATDYWFLADVVKGEERFTVNGHFSLRR
jgi:gliding motility-associated-like protein